LFIGIVGIFAPIAWDLWSKRSELTVEIKQAVTILQKEKTIQKLGITYDGKSINSLSKTVLVLRNSGKTPISKDDVITPVTLKFKDSEILEVTKIRQLPLNLGADVNNDNHVITSSFQLLNPADELELSVLTAEGNPKFTAEARIKNIHNIVVTDLTDPKKGRWSVGLGAYVSGIVGLFFMLGAILMLKKLPVRNKQLALLKSPNSPILQSSSIDECKNYVPAHQGAQGGQKITVNADFSLNVPDQPIIPYIEGDGTGLDITPVMIKVVDAAVAKAYGGKKKIHWMESTPARSRPRSTARTCGCPKKRCRCCASTWSRSRAR
jgi:hypothetical protein